MVGMLRLLASVGYLSLGQLHPRHPSLGQFVQSDP